MDFGFLFRVCSLLQNEADLLLRGILRFIRVTSNQTVIGCDDDDMLIFERGLVTLFAGMSIEVY